MYVVIIVLNPCNSCTCIYNKITNTTCSTHINEQQQSNFDIYRDPPPQKKNQISKLKFDTLLWA
jgi:hypothetical protein